MSDTYNAAFFAFHEKLSRQSASLCVPLVLEMVPAASVVDVGCGIGTWLAEYKAAGVSDYLGVDGDYVSREQLLIERERFLPHQLTQPLRVNRRFDLANCLEVAEHLPAASADVLVESLVKLAPVVMFSAAIPHQGGHDHINEQWPDYWHARFAAHGYVVVDALRRKIWRKPGVARWYAQNMLFYVDRQRVGDYPQLATVFAADGDAAPLSLVHPEHYLDVYGALFEKIKHSQCVAMKALLRLRQINLAAFPDWTQPAEVQKYQMRALCQALLYHPQQQRTCVVLHMGAEPQAAAQIVERVTREIELATGLSQEQMPALRGVSPTFGADQWEVVLACVQGRISLPGEASAMVQMMGAASQPAISLEAISRQQPLPGQDVAAM
jgi:SAM-dependent methyltransferase